ncbi:hypothetical protein COEREDRAFT_83994 [Coemansia reversa NRRL 1564]|uniref:Uncharacterized protein n=1 Tax=Coemansia reversa (strain ATCC 12441 / NRRL 1564) TaxID=763665 RepID=A0A2G5B0V1_COERN|nr:hypothetical protein COEREDRAFT_83994 [Coemansia reversa NRRL 1564]|eukprot:PIA12648.1 hypothetical protein COEREDRAFT_83994 [Coemansia reversa NRRL 1564]
MRIHPVVSWSYLKKYNESDRFKEHTLDKPLPVEINNHLEYRIEKIVSHRNFRNKQ